MGSGCCRCLQAKHTHALFIAAALTAHAVSCPETQPLTLVPVLASFSMQGYIFKVMGGNDKQGFGMKQGVLTNQRVRLLMSRGQQCFRGHGRRDGEATKGWGAQG